MIFGIRARLLAAFIAIALFTGILGWYAISTMERMNAGQRTVYGDVFGGTHLLATWVDTSWQARSDLLNYLLADDPVSAAAYRQEMQQLDQRLADLVQRMDQADTDREDVATLAALVSAWDAYTNWRDQVVLAELDRGNRAEALAAYREGGSRMGTTVDEMIDAFLAKKREVGATLEGQAEASFDLTRHIAILLSIAAAGLGLGIGFFLSRSIARGVGQVANRCVPPKTSPYTVRWPAFMRSIVEIAYQPRMPVNNAMAMNAARSLARIPNIKSYPPWRAEERNCPDARAAARADHNTGKSEHWLRNGNEAVMFFAFRASPEIRDTPMVGRRWTAYSAHGEFRIAVPAQFGPRLGRSARRPRRPRDPDPRPPDAPAGQRTRRRAGRGRAARR